MHIDAIKVYYVKIKMAIPWKTAYGEDHHMHSILVCLCSGDKTGWSETGPLCQPTFSPEYAYGVYYLVTEFMAQRLAGHDIDSPEDLMECLSDFKGNPFAKSSLETAWWTLNANIRGIPLHELLGGNYKEVDVGADFGIHEDTNVLIAKMESAYASGYKRIKLKVKPGKDIQVLKEVRRRFPANIIHVDCNSGYTLKDLPVFQEMDQYDLAMIEQPLSHDDIRDHAILQAKIKTPICLDESCNSVRSAQEALEIGACKFINIKPGRVGGLKNSIDIIKMCKNAGIGCWIGGMLETGIASGVRIALATLDNIVYPGDIFPLGVMYDEELATQDILLSSPGKMKPLDFAGFPYEPRADMLENRTVFSACIQ